MKNLFGISRWGHQVWGRPSGLILGSLFVIRWSKGVLFADAYAFITRPFWPGPSQREWLQKATQVETNIRLDLLEQDNKRLRRMLSLKRAKEFGFFSVPVISRKTNGWWGCPHLENTRISIRLCQQKRSKTQ